MLTIRKSQVEVLAKSLEVNFVKRMVIHLKLNFTRQLANQGIEGEDLFLIVQRGVENAAFYSVINEGDVRLFVECIALLGLDFDKAENHPMANEILNRRDLSGEEKMNQISEYLTFL